MANMSSLPPSTSSSPPSSTPESGKDHEKSIKPRFQTPKKGKDKGAGHLHRDSNLTNIESIIGGGVAGLTTRVVIAPLDVLKIRLQLQIPDVTAPKAIKSVYSLSSSGIYQMAKKILHEEGIRAFWKGNVSAEIMYVAYGATQFASIRQAHYIMNTRFPGKLSESTQSFIAGSVAGCVSTTVTYPFDLLRTRFAVQAAGKGSVKVYKNISYAFRNIYQLEGPRGLFRGLSTSLISISPYMGLFFLTYLKLHAAFEKIDLDKYIGATAYAILPPGWREGTAGLLAGLISKAAIFPLDTVRRRLQVQGPTRAYFAGGLVPAYPESPIKCVAMIFKQEGFRGFYRGYLVSICKSAPTSMVTMWTFEHTIKLMRHMKAESLEA
ncbi:mitochondrial thiamine pyrophosphate carrier 1 [Nadsonia fulvescens var. elongata DSM 6958]|uniref:Mitochondrial thiamine pyrophosphate carrier 1 n=1 Tax=Nadsonia fulvescens var. elongata DSM 6958 TaxID=857566 RepID=A0A1E3PLQ8_9ASCO|nr:mitochondrial thiamine pyrophosphate carrier 1 [Nadsonia fulvescens var. elongata DSM 6958]